MTRLTDEERDELSRKVAKKNEDTQKRPRFALTAANDACPLCGRWLCTGDC